MDKYGYIGIETLLNFCENSKDHAVTPNDFMRMNRVRVPERKTGQLDNDHIWNELSKVYNMDSVPDEAKSIIGDVMLGLGEQPDHTWHECFDDDPASFPDDDRLVLMSFSNYPAPAVGWFMHVDDGGFWTDGTEKSFVELGLFVDGWWELPRKPEGRE